MQAKVASGVKASEVSYQLAFSKQELRKVINQYPGSTVSYLLFSKRCSKKTTQVNDAKNVSALLYSKVVVCLKIVFYDTKLCSVFSDCCVKFFILFH